MNWTYQTAFIQWIPLPEHQHSMFSIYRTEAAIELHIGCRSREDARFICAQNSYDAAYEFCEWFAQQTGLLIQDYTLDHPIHSHPMNSNYENFPTFS